MKAFVFSLVLVAIVVAVPPPCAEACRVEDPSRRMPECGMLRGRIGGGEDHSPLRDDLPLRGVVFVDGNAPVRWARGHGTFHTRPLALGVLRVDYIADGDAALAVGDVAYTISSRAPAPRRPHALSLHRERWSCDTIEIISDVPVAAMKARLTRRDRIEDYWLVSSFDLFTLTPVHDSDPKAAPIDDATLELFAITSDGREHHVSKPVLVRTIPMREFASHDDVSVEETELDLLAMLAVLLWLAALGVHLRGAPSIALCGKTIRGYLPRLRFRIRLPRARIHRR